MEERRKPFQHLDEKDNLQFLQDGMQLYVAMRKKYPKNTDVDLDNILNGLCAAILCLMKNHVDIDNYSYVIQHE